MRCGELVATDELTILSEPLLDATAVEDSQGNRHFPADSSCTDEGDWGEAFCEANDLLDQLIASKTSPGRRGEAIL